MEQQCWWESEQAQQIAGGWTIEKQNRHDERQKQAGDRESDWKLLVQQLEQDGISFSKSRKSLAAIESEPQSTTHGSEPEASRRQQQQQQQQSEAAGSSGRESKQAKKQRRRQRVEAKLGAAAAAAAQSAAAEAEEMRGLMGPGEIKPMTPEAPEMELEESGVALHQEPAASIAEELQGQDEKLKEDRKKEKEKRRRQKRRQKTAEAKATAAEEEQQCCQ